jgi:hypothetical protein
VLIVISKQTIINLILVVGGPDLLLDIGLALPVCKKLVASDARGEPLTIRANQKESGSNKVFGPYKSANP